MSYESSTFLGLGSNLGDREQNLANAVKMLSENMEVIKASRVFESKPMANLSQPNYLNQVLMVKENYLATDLLLLVKKIEQNLGRKPAARWSARVIDIDILFKQNMTLNTVNLKIPHIGYHQRDFVLIPLAEIAPDFMPPGQDKCAKELVAHTSHILQEE